MVGLLLPDFFLMGPVNQESSKHPAPDYSRHLGSLKIRVPFKFQNSAAPFKKKTLQGTLKERATLIVPLSKP